MSSYLYRPLQVAKNEIRLIALQPAEGDSTVEVEIIHVSLYHNPTYEALSYVWGSPTVTEEIHILDSPRPIEGLASTQRQQISQKESTASDLERPHLDNELYSPVDSNPNISHSIHIFKATTNLESALKHLRLLDKPRLLWVDAICINQQDHREKEYQVRRMDQIYRMCSQVCIWLGEAADNSDLAMDLLESIESSWQFATLEPSSDKITFRDTFLPVARRFLEDEQFIIHFRALVNLIYRPWFNRLWIVQEVVLAPIRTVFCGNKSASWGLMFRIFLFLFLDGGLKDKLETSTGYSPALIFQHLPFDIASQWRSAVAAFMRLGTMAINWDKGAPTLRALLLELRGRGMTDKRDAIYGLLSLAGDVSSRDWDVDYGITRIQVFKVAVKKIIEASRCLDIICDGSVCPHGNYVSPSWLPSFDAEELSCGCSSFRGSSLTSRGSERMKEGEISSLYDASKGSTPNFTIDEEGSGFTTTGVFADCIKSVMQMPIWTPIPRNEPDLTIPRQWFSVALSSESSVFNNQEDSGAYQLHPRKFEALWRTVIADRVESSNDSAPSVLGESFRAWLEHEHGDLTVSGNEVINGDAHTGLLSFKARLYTTVRHS